MFLSPVQLNMPGVPGREVLGPVPVEVGDVVRPGSHRAVDRPRRLGLRPLIATGDRGAPAHRVARELGIDEVHARCTPEDKAALVKDLQERGCRVVVETLAVVARPGS
ncbi:P-type E1-E2 ATPase [Streptomyces canus]|nr:P-type E1-E2 ATPase [Streptomyces canus]